MLRHGRRNFLVILVLTLCVALPPAAQSPGTPAKQGFRILISNDDGFDAPGIVALREALRGAGEVIVVAPKTEQSGKGHSLTLREPLLVEQRPSDTSGVSWYAVEATPASCVMWALHSLIPEKDWPDLVISGINRGDNAGLSVYVSGTLGAAREAAFAGIPAIAVSMDLSASGCCRQPKDFATAAQYVRQLVDDLRARKMLKPGLFLNVNAPPGEIKGTRLTRMTTRRSKNWFERVPGNDQAYRSRYEPLADDAEGTDVWAMKRGLLAITPLMLDNGDKKAMKGLRKLEKKAAMAAAK